ncbi:MAG: lytic murein transglycosylase B [Gammaproteobacteria bacterium]|nr:lytic murein transglycosylase B [Gammaproteobacteria bacterium]
MKIKKIQLLLTALCSLCLVSAYAATNTTHKSKKHKTNVIKQRPRHSAVKPQNDVQRLQITKREQKFIRTMVMKYHFKKNYVTKLIRRFQYNPIVIHKIEQPYEAQPWYIYRKAFITQERARAGAIFWLHHKKVLARAEKKYGVPASIICALVGIETYYGRGEGTFGAFNALATLAFYYPPRSVFFNFELEQYLLLTRHLKISPWEIQSSYAGALGYPQFMPSSYLTYAVDFSGDNKIDLFHNTTDVIGSIANFLYQQGWKRGETITVRAKVTGKHHHWLLNRIHTPIYKISTLRKFGITPVKHLPGDTRANLIKFKIKYSNEYWLGLHNFYVITHYNTSPEYAMAAVQLAERIRSYYEDN